ncbi:MAG: hypothetical protein U0T11_09555 [Chitinophagaceae bacterium]
MRLLRFSSALLAVSFFAVSCMKEKSFSSTGTTGNTGNTNTSKSIVGNWKFVSIAGSTAANVELKDGTDVMKMLTLLTFSSSNPTGVYKITSTQMSGENVGYTYIGTSKVTAYMNNELLSDISQPVNSTIAGYNSSSNYRLFGTDSIYFDTNTAGGPGTAAVPIGGRYKLDGTKLTFTFNTSTTETVDVGGIPAKQTMIIKTTVLLEKQ